MGNTFNGGTGLFATTHGESDEPSSQATPLPTNRQSQYYQTHPGAHERSIVFLNHALASESTPPPPSLVAEFKRIKAKLRAWTDPPNQTLIPHR